MCCVCPSNQFCYPVVQDTSSSSSAITIPFRPAPLLHVVRKSSAPSLSCADHPLCPKREGEKKRRGKQEREAKLIFAVHHHLSCVDRHVQDEPGLWAPNSQLSGSALHAMPRLCTAALFALLPPPPTLSLPPSSLLSPLSYPYVLRAVFFFSVRHVPRTPSHPCSLPPPAPCPFPAQPTKSTNSSFASGGRASTNVSFDSSWTGEGDVPRAWTNGETIADMHLSPDKTAGTEVVCGREHHCARARKLT